MSTPPRCRDFLVWSLACCFAACAGVLHAQSTASGDAASKTVTLVQTVQPSFYIEPVVQRFEGRRGAVIPFEFLIASTGKQMDVVVRAVSLRQEESGIILHDPDRSPSDAIRFTTPTEFKLSRGESRPIRGEITVPLVKANFLSFGILVQDRGQMSAPDSADSRADKTDTKAGVRFVTQYVLRVDVETHQAAGSALGRLKLRDGAVVPADGFPLARAYVVNPTDYAFEFRVRGAVSCSGPAIGFDPFRLSMPSRANLTPDERDLVRIMPHSRLRLEAPLTTPLFPGEHRLHVGVSNGRREMAGADFPIAVSAGDFPAAETMIACLGDAVSVSPAYIRLGNIEGTDRTTGLKFTNHSPSPQEISLDVQPLPGGSPPPIRLSSRSFVIRPGSSKYVRAMIRSQRDLEEARYGWVQARAVGQLGTEGKKSLPVALFYGPPEDTLLAHTALEFYLQDDLPAFRMTVKNESRGFVPVHAELEISDRIGRNARLTAGYGRWLIPGESAELRFVPEFTLVSGEYQLALVLRTFDERPPTTRTTLVRLSPSQETGLTSQVEASAETEESKPSAG